MRTGQEITLLAFFVPTTLYWYMAGEKNYLELIESYVGTRQGKFRCTANGPGCLGEFVCHRDGINQRGKFNNYSCGCVQNLKGPAWLPGVVVGRYRLIECVGSKKVATKKISKIYERNLHEWKAEALCCGEIVTINTWQLQSQNVLCSCRRYKAGKWYKAGDIVGRCHKYQLIERVPPQYVTDTKQRWWKAVALCCGEIVTLYSTRALSLSGLCQCQKAKAEAHRWACQHGIREANVLKEIEENEERNRDRTESDDEPGTEPLR